MDTANADDALSDIECHAWKAIHRLRESHSHQKYYLLKNAPESPGVHTWEMMGQVKREAPAHVAELELIQQE
jgi:hypothetical protein